MGRLVPPGQNDPVGHTPPSDPPLPSVRNALSKTLDVEIKLTCKLNSGKREKF